MKKDKEHIFMQFGVILGLISYLALIIIYTLPFIWG
jgi:hypothetical protein